MTRIKHLHRKKVKGREYFYFDTGTRNEAGRKIFAPIVGPRDPGFPRAYALACEQRKRRRNIAPTRTFEWLLKAFEKSPEFRLKSVNTQKSYLNSLGKASVLLRDWEGRSTPLDRIEPSDVLAIRDKLIDGGGANQAVRVLSALFSWASHPTRKFMASNPAVAVELFGEGEHQPWPLALVEDALSDPHTRLAVGLLYFTGQRISDVIGMRWSDIRDGRIHLVQQKTGKALQIPIAAELRVILDETPMRGLTILTKSNAKPYTANGLRPMLQAWAREKGFNVVPHGLRKNAVNALLEAGCSTAEAAAITGQSLKMVEHYAKQRDTTVLADAAILRLDTARQKRAKAGT